ncbi:MAG: carboxy terminal-processing peptidase [Gammaproteobacteria bacterium]|nr:carboxy terminal-processing peptidase [Gammaproteobacteria bacterium]
MTIFSAASVVALTAALISADAPQVALRDTSPISIKPLTAHASTSLKIVEQLRHHHYVRKPLDDSASSQFFDKYLDMLDPGRAYFLAADIQDFEKYRYTLDDALKHGDLDPAFTMFNKFQTRVVDRLEFLLVELDADLDKMDFSLDEEVEIDREQAPWPSSPDALDDLWYARLKASVLGMKLNGKELDEIQKLLTKRYQNRLKQTRQTKAEDAFQLYVNAFASTYDPHTQYFSPRNSENFNINMSLSLEGIGAVLRNDDEYTAVVRLVAAGPADKSGTIKPSDRIIGVGQGQNGKLIDVVGWRLDDVVELIRGPKGSIVRLEVIPAGAESDAAKTIQITRNTVKLEEQSAQRKMLTYNRGGREVRVGVIQIPTFYVDFKAIQQGNPNFKSTTRDVRRLIDELKEEGVAGIVIDLRNNGGGSLQEADTLTGLFIKSGPTVQVKSARRNAHIYSDTDDLVTWSGPLAVLVNRLSASASEIFAGAIQDYERGIITGSQTFGKGTVQTLIPLNRGQLKITQAKYYRVSGQSTQHQGVIPDIAFPEIYDTDRVGESSLDGALPWDMIKPAVYPSLHSIEPVLPLLKSKHKQRAADDADFTYLRALAERSHQNRDKTHVSLNEAVRVAEKEADDAWRLTLENTLLVAKGEDPLPDLDALDARHEAEPDDKDPNKDAMLRETGDVLLDYIGLTQQIAMLESPVDPIVR